MRSLRFSKRRPRSLREPQGPRPPQGPRLPQATRGDRGAATVVTAGLIAAIAAFTALALPLYSALVVKQSVAAAADAAALAAADVAVGRVAGFPCSVATRVAAANGASATDCELDGLVATVTVSRSLLGIPVTARATAGPAPGEAD